MTGTFDPITLEVLRNRFDAIAAEIQFTLLRSAFSVILKEGEDCSAAIFNARGEIVAQSTALPQHMGAFIPALARIMAGLICPRCSSRRRRSSTIGWTAFACVSRIRRTSAGLYRAACRPIRLKSIRKA